MAKEGDLKIWHVPQVPGEPFEVPVSSPEEGAKLLEVLANYDAFQYECSIKPDYCNASGLVAFIEGEWVDWEFENDMDLDEYMEHEHGSDSND